MPSECISDLEMVAGDALDTSWLSKRRLVLPGILMISPDMRHSFRFSSSTVFRFSIHSESTGPSKINHLRSEPGIKHILMLTESCGILNYWDPGILTGCWFGRNTRNKITQRGYHDLLDKVTLNKMISEYRSFFLTTTPAYHDVGKSVREAAIKVPSLVVRKLRPYPPPPGAKWASD